MLQSILYFILGFLCCGLLALMVAPAIWNRAVALTQKKVESSVPLTLNEIQSDKDQLRAEFAMTTRRLEMSIEELREKNAVQAVEVNRKRDEMAKFAEDAEKDAVKIKELENTSENQQAQIADRDKALTLAVNDLKTMKADLEQKTLDLEQTKIKLEQTSAESEARRAELATKETTIENLNSKFEQLTHLDSENADELKSIVRENTELKTQMRKLEIDLEKKTRLAERFENQTSELQDRVARRDAEISQLQTGGKTKSPQSSDELATALSREKSRAMELEANLAKTTLQMEAMMDNSSNANVKKAVQTLKDQHADLRQKMTDLGKERDSLKAELAKTKGSKTSGNGKVDTDNANLRDRINELAAQVTAMTAASEGKNSPINKLVKQAPTKRGSSAKPGQQTLAERIRAVQEAASTVSK